MNDEPKPLAPPPATPPRAAADAAVLELRNVGKRFGRTTVLQGIDLRVHTGEVVAIVGANGSGKSTLLSICAGLVAPDEGVVVVRGTIGWCPQHGGVAEGLRADEQFVLFGAGRELTRAGARRAGRRLAHTLDWDPPALVAGKLSGGTRQKLNVVLAGIGEPALLLLDEPYQGFDQGSYLDFWEQVWRWRTAGHAVVVVTHLLHELHRVDQVLDLGRSGAQHRAAS